MPSLQSISMIPTLEVRVPGVLEIGNVYGLDTGTLGSRGLCRKLMSQVSHLEVVESAAELRSISMIPTLEVRVPGMLQGC